MIKKVIAVYPVDGVYAEQYGIGIHSIPGAVFPIVAAHCHEQAVDTYYSTVTSNIFLTSDQCRIVPNILDISAYHYPPPYATNIIHPITRRHFGI